MRTFTFSLLLGVLCLPVSSVAAQEEGDEEGGDTSLDALMAADPESEEPPEDAPEGETIDAEGQEAASAEDAWDEEAFMDDERPPGDPEEPAPQPEPDDTAEADAGEKRPVSLGVLLGYGLGLEEGANAWGLGAGVQGRYDLGLLSFGVRFVYYVGESETITRPNIGIGEPTTEEVSLNLWELGIEAAVDLDLSDEVTLRPGLGLGLAAVSRSASTNSAPYLAPGVAVHYAVSESIYLGLDSRFQIVMRDPQISAVVFLPTLGMRF